jgi:putative oxidoreductase
MNTAELETVWAPRVLSILRIVAALIFMEHGTQKLLGFPPSDRPSPELFSLIGLAGLLELVGGALLVLGLFTRPVAFILSGEMAFAYFLSHAPEGFWPIQNRGELAALFCFLFLFLAANGGGRFSLDGLFRGSRARLGDERTGVDVRAGGLAMAIAAAVLAPCTAVAQEATERSAQHAAAPAGSDAVTPAPATGDAVTGGPAAATPEEIEAFGAWDAAYETFREAYREGDAAAVAGVYAEDAFYLGPGRDVVRGRAGIQEAFRPFLESGPPGTYDITFELMEREVSADLGYEVGYYDLRSRKGEEEGRSRGKFTVVWKRGPDGAWRIQSDTYSGVEQE